MTGGRALSILRTPGAVVDRLAILELKQQFFTDARHRQLAADECAALRNAWDTAGLPSYSALDGASELAKSNSELWWLENEIREREHARRFDAKFIESVATIQRTNRVRADLRRTITEHVVRTRGMGLLKVPTGIDAFADQIAIENVAARMSGSPASPVESVLKRIWMANGLPDLFTGACFSALRLANERLWRIKDDLDVGFFNGQQTPSITATCRSLYLVNDARARFKGELATSLGSALRDAKEYSDYSVPSNWDATGLQWIGVNTRNAE